MRRGCRQYAAITHFFEIRSASQRTQNTNISVAAGKTEILECIHIQFQIIQSNSDLRYMDHQA